MEKKFFPIFFHANFFFHENDQNLAKRPDTSTSKKRKVPLIYGKVPLIFGEKETLIFGKETLIFHKSPQSWDIYEKVPVFYI